MRTDESVSILRVGLKTVDPFDITYNDSRSFVKSLRTTREQVSLNVVVLVFPLVQLRAS